MALVGCLTLIYIRMKRLSETDDIAATVMISLIAICDDLKKPLTFKQVGVLYKHYKEIFGKGRLFPHKEFEKTLKQEINEKT
jgi:hypothetical protein